MFFPVEFLIDLGNVFDFFLLNYKYKFEICRSDMLYGDW